VNVVLEGWTSDVFRVGRICLFPGIAMTTIMITVLMMIMAITVQCRSTSVSAVTSDSTRSITCTTGMQHDLFLFATLPLKGVQSIVITMSVCLSVACSLAFLRNRMAELCEILCCVTDGHGGLVLL